MEQKFLTWEKKGSKMLSYNLVFVLQGKELPSTLAEAEELNSSTVLDSQSTSLQSSTEDNSPTE